MSGLAAGLRYALMGKSALVVERHYRVGGLNSYYRGGGHDLDVGLHAMTNYRTDGKRSAPLPKLLRQLRIRLDDLDLIPQKSSKIVFPDATLCFGNGLDLLIGTIDARFPKQVDNFKKLLTVVESFDELDPDSSFVSARKMVSSLITDPGLVEMLFTPLQYYGSAIERDMDFWVFVVMFKAVFIEGFCRPANGIRPLLDLLVAKLEKEGGSLQLRDGVKQIMVTDGKVTGVLLDSGQVVETSAVLSSAGLVETKSLLPDEAVATYPDGVPGELAFIETVNLLDTSAAELGEESTIIFYNDSPTFHYGKAGAPVDLRSGVICFPGNFQYRAKDNPIHSIRTTHLANYDYWYALDEDDYSDEKILWTQRSLATAALHTIDPAGKITFNDTFTPKTVTRYTGHIHGCVYGSPEKNKPGKTGITGLYLCGTDQGYLGIVGAMLSGISIANLTVMEKVV
jgi:phytoene dehydrogenase-like protein